MPTQSTPYPLGDMPTFTMLADTGSTVISGLIGLLVLAVGVRIVLTLLAAKF